ncbi:hypothetical protein [Clostridium ihumii]|uniref:hypothetical protein n=1 Tax=Clostridium ihumii TaxID=1470356 RepID=UPI00058C7FCF|nr:hypothetical protein [Clostridium ihumii]
MRVFKMNKENSDEQLDEYKDFKMNENFNGIDIVNPKNSNSIYIVNDIIVKNPEENNIINIYGCNLNEDETEEVMESVNLQDDDVLLFHKEEIMKDRSINILNKDYFIILPGASLVIEFVNYDKKLNLRVHSYKEEL